MEAGPQGNIQSELLLEKDAQTFTFKQGWAFPRKVYFNGDECMLPPLDAYPYLPNIAPVKVKRKVLTFLAPITVLICLLNFV